MFFLNWIVFYIKIIDFFLQYASFILLCAFFFDYLFDYQILSFGDTGRGIQYYWNPHPVLLESSSSNFLKKERNKFNKAAHFWQKARFFRTSFEARKNSF